MINFYPESGHMVYGVENKFYFEAFTDSERSDFAHIENAQLWSVSKNPTFAPSDELVLDNISSTHLGRGHFSFTPDSELKYYFLWEKKSNNEVIFSFYQELAIKFSDVLFHIENPILLNDQDLEV